MRTKVAKRNVRLCIPMASTVAEPGSGVAQAPPRSDSRCSMMPKMLIVSPERLRDSSSSGPLQMLLRNALAAADRQLVRLVLLFFADILVPLMSLCLLHVAIIFFPGHTSLRWNSLFDLESRRGVVYERLHLWQALHRFTFWLMNEANGTERSELVEWEKFRVSCDELIFPSRFFFGIFKLARTHHQPCHCSLLISSIYELFVRSERCARWISKKMAWRGSLGFIHQRGKSIVDRLFVSSLCQLFAECETHFFQHIFTFVHPHSWRNQNKANHVRGFSAWKLSLGPRFIIFHFYEAHSWSRLDKAKKKKARHLVGAQNSNFVTQLSRWWCNLYLFHAHMELFLLLQRSLPFFSLQNSLLFRCDAFSFRLPLIKSSIGERLS